MKNIPTLVIAYIIICGVTLTACNEHENPLKTYQAKDVAAWIFKHKNAEIIACAEVEWQEVVNLDCKNTAKDLAFSLKNAGFGDVITEDIKLPTIWTEFNERIRASKANKYSAEATHKIFGSMKQKKPLDNQVK